uniref:AB hydrolase-1 domain-containing protein n=1 Tax=Rhabditophanes sp. KR3021 TaxID=114890 RepID=A0AC35TRE4_9BILA
MDKPQRKRRGPTVDELEKCAKNPRDAMRIRLNHLERNIDKLVELPPIPDEDRPKTPPEFVRNVVGSSAAAGSAEFHIFRNNRRKEYDRLAYIDKQAEKEELDAKYKERRDAIKKEEDDKLAKKAAKNRKRKEKLKELRRKGKKNNDLNSGEEDDEVSDNESVDANNEEILQETLIFNMFSYIKTLIFGPKVYGILFNPDYYYVKNIGETVGDKILDSFRGFHYFTIAAWPVLLFVGVNHNFITVSTIKTLIKVFFLCYGVGFSIRFFGRLASEQYRVFATELINSNQKSSRQIYKKYDFQLNECPISLDNSGEDMSKRKFFDDRMDGLQDWGYFNFIQETLSFIAVHSFGKRLLYPGGVALLQYLMDSSILQMRKKLLLIHKAERLVLATPEGDQIDSILVDKRNSGDINGKTLVICCEGNAGFYEVGLCNAVIPLGYSVMGWNPPGFVESKGYAVPSKILAAADTVFQSALAQGFNEEDIIIYGWSIGGFPATWLAANYPKIKKLVLDATFDDVLPLAEMRMPQKLSGVVAHAIRTHLNLPIAKQLAAYKGDVKLIRRMHDEIIITNDSGTEKERRASNRANDLLKSLLTTRHAGMFSDTETMKYVDKWLGVVDRIGLSATNQIESQVYSLCDKYFMDVDRGHNDQVDDNSLKNMFALNSNSKL